LQYDEAFHTPKAEDDPHRCSLVKISFSLEYSYLNSSNLIGQ